MADEYYNLPSRGIQAGSAFMRGTWNSYNRATAMQADIIRYRDSKARADKSMAMQERRLEAYEDYTGARITGLSRPPGTNISSGADRARLSTELESYTAWLAEEDNIKNYPDKAEWYRNAEAATREKLFPTAAPEDIDTAGEAGIGAFPSDVSQRPQVSGLQAAADYFMPESKPAVTGIRQGLAKEEARMTSLGDTTPLVPEAPDARYVERAVSELGLQASSDQIRERSGELAMVDNIKALAESDGELTEDELVGALTPRFMEKWNALDDVTKSELLLVLKNFPPEQAFEALEGR